MLPVVSQEMGVQNTPINWNYHEVENHAHRVKEMVDGLKGYVLFQVWVSGSFYRDNQMSCLQNDRPVGEIDQQIHWLTVIWGHSEQAQLEKHHGSSCNIF